MIFSEFNEDTINIYKIPTLILETITLSLNGITNQALKLKINNTKGPKKNKTDDAFCGIGFSFTNSFKASLIGCNNPKNPVVLGPLRLCILPRTLRSNNVKKATVSIIHNTKYIDNKSNKIVLKKKFDKINLKIIVS